MGRENGYEVATGLGIAAPAGLKIYREILDYYAALPFDTTTVVKHITGILAAHGLSENPDVETVAGIKIYPQDYFNPISTVDGSMHRTERTRSIHHFAQSWVSPFHRFLRRAAIAILGAMNKEELSKFILNLRRK